MAELGNGGRKFPAFPEWGASVPCGRQVVEQAVFAGGALCNTTAAKLHSFRGLRRHEMRICVVSTKRIYSSVSLQSLNNSN